MTQLTLESTVYIYVDYDVWVIALDAECSSGYKGVQSRSEVLVHADSRLRLKTMEGFHWYDICCGFDVRTPKFSIRVLSSVPKYTV